MTGLLYGKLSVFLTFTPTVVPILYFYMVSEHSANWESVYRIENRFDILNASLSML